MILKSLNNKIEEITSTFLKEKLAEYYFIVLKMLPKQAKRESAQDLTTTWIKIFLLQNSSFSQYKIIKATSTFLE